MLTLLMNTLSLPLSLETICLDESIKNPFIRICKELIINWNYSETFPMMGALKVSNCSPILLIHPGLPTPYT